MGKNCEEIRKCFILYFQTLFFQRYLLDSSIEVRIDCFSLVAYHKKRLGVLQYIGELVDRYHQRVEMILVFFETQISFSPKLPSFVKVPINNFVCRSFFDKKYCWHWKLHLPGMAKMHFVVVFIDTQFQFLSETTDQISTIEVSLDSFVL